MNYNITTEDYIKGGTQKNFYSESEVETCLCPLCATSEYKPVYKERGHLGVVICKKCGLIYTNPRAIAAEENFFGDEKIFFAEARLIFNGKKPHHRDRNYDYELNEIKKIKSSGKLLDIGSNIGFFLRKAKAKGYEVEGVEPSSALAKMSQELFNLQVRNGYFEASAFPSHSVDIITMIDVFEHVTNPGELLKSAHKVLKDDGILCIKVPNGNYNMLKLKLAKMTGKESQYDIFDSCEHVVHYTPSTLKEMLRLHGFKIKKLILPLPVHPPVWSGLVGHYYQYPSPFILDWKRILMRNFFYYAGKLQKLIGAKISFAPDLMAMVEKDRGSVAI